MSLGTHTPAATALLLPLHRAPDPATAALLWWPSPLLAACSSGLLMGHSAILLLPLSNHHMLWVSKGLYSTTLGLSNKLVLVPDLCKGVCPVCYFLVLIQIAFWPLPLSAAHPDLLYIWSFSRTQPLLTCTHPTAKISIFCCSTLNRCLLYIHKSAPGGSDLDIPCGKVHISLLGLRAKSLQSLRVLYLV